MSSDLRDQARPTTVGPRVVGTPVHAEWNLTQRPTAAFGPTCIFGFAEGSSTGQSADSVVAPLFGRQLRLRVTHRQQVAPLGSAVTSEEVERHAQPKSSRNCPGSRSTVVERGAARSATMRSVSEGQQPPLRQLALVSVAFTSHDRYVATFDDLDTGQEIVVDLIVQQTPAGIVVGHAVPDVSACWDGDAESLRSVFAAAAAIGRARRRRDDTEEE